MSTVLQVLEKYLREKSRKEPEAFPNNKDGYYKQYAHFADYLDREVHPFVNQTAMIIDSDDELGFLTDHGPGHIKTVMQRASQLLGGNMKYINGYEAYMLLTAMHIHDAGHIRVGRVGHEKASKPLLAAQLGADSVENKYIWTIAEAHGGKTVTGDKDKIGLLSPVTFGSRTINIPFLAALLRFADELADDRTRAARYVFDAGRIPKSSEVFHAYSYALTSVDVALKEKEVRLNFHLSQEDAMRKFGKLKEETFLLDEILVRTFKMYEECVYCMRFFPYELQLNSISVRIEISENFEDIHQPINYRLRETGYPRLHAQSPAELCSKDLTIDGVIINGIVLKNRIEESVKEKA